jgi:glutathione S-transferase
MITLYDLAGDDPALRFSPYCWRIRMALAHKGLDAATVPWRFSDKANLPGAPANQTVPVLTDGDEVVAGSTDIAVYLENRYANGPSLFGGAAGEAHARFIIAWADTTLIPALAPLVAPCVLPVLQPADQPYFQSSREARFGATFEQLVADRPQRLEKLRPLLLPLRTTLASQSFLGGDEPSYADYAVFGCFQWARCVGAPPVLEPDDTLTSWIGELLNLFDGLARRAMVVEASQG